MSAESYYHYQIAGQTIASSMPFGGMADQRSGEEFVTLRRSTAIAAEHQGQLPASAFQIPKSNDCYHHWKSSEDDTNWLSFAVQTPGYVLVFHDSAVFTVDRVGKNVTCYPFVGVTENTIQHLFLDIVLPLLMQQSGQLVLHASCVSFGQSAIGFLGMSGSGKSSLASCCVGQGAKLLTDDFLLLEKQDNAYQTIPSYPHVRLWEDSLEKFFPETDSSAAVAHYSDKVRVAISEADYCQSAKPLTALYVLEGVDPDSAPRCSKLSRQEAFLEVIKCGFVLDVADSKTATAHFSLITELVQSVPVSKLFLPGDYGSLGSVVELIVGHS